MDNVDSLSMRAHWSDLRAQKIHERDEKLSAFRELVHDVDSPSVAHKIGVKSPLEILKMLTSGELSCAASVEHYISATIRAHDKTNCVTEPLFVAACERAAALDRHYKEFQTPIGPLHGLPMSIKDQFDIAGVDSTIGWSSLIGKPARRDCVLVQILRAAGAIPIVKTNLPQTIMFAETLNPVFGETTHPLNSAYSPGGSSGGEAALLASHGALLGWGTDLGGSIRMPCHLTGLYGLRPSHGRLPYQDVTVTQFGNETVPSVVGPMCLDLDLLTLATKTVIDAEPWRYDPKCLPLPWRAQGDIARMKIGVLWDDGILEPLPPVKRALRQMVDKLEAAGHEVVDWTPDNHAEMIDVMDELFVIDKCADFKAFLMPDEPVMPRVRKMMDRGADPALTGSVTSLWALQRRKQALQKAHLDRTTTAGVDFLLTPVMATPAAPCGKHCWSVSYTKFVNLLDLTAAVFPVTTVLASDARSLGRAAKSLAEADAWAVWDPVAQHGMPIGLQLVGKRLEEEKVLHGVRYLASLLR